MSFRYGHIPVDPIAHFMQEHDQALQQLATLGGATRALLADGFTEGVFRKIESAIRYIEEEVRVHNRREEKALFPVLERYVEGPTRHMREEHRMLRGELTRLRSAATKVRRRKADRAAAEEFATVSRSMVQLLVNHIHKENHILFPLIQKFLTKDALREIAQLITSQGGGEPVPSRRTSANRKQRGLR